MQNKELTDILKTMDLPEKRRDIYNAANLRWLARNIQFRNFKHPKIKEAIELIKELILLSDKKSIKENKKTGR